MLWEEFLPPEVGVLSEELTAIDALLDDDRFLAPFSQRLMSKVGRPTITMETYLRLMYLKHRHTLGYETLVKEVADSLSRRRFCLIRLDDPSPTRRRASWPRRSALMSHFPPERGFRSARRAVPAKRKGRQVTTTRPPRQSTSAHQLTGRDNLTAAAFTSAAGRALQ